MSRKAKPKLEPPTCKHCGETVDTPPADWPLEECESCLRKLQTPWVPRAK